MDHDARGEVSRVAGGPAPLALHTDFYRAWEIVEAADPTKYSPAVRSRAFSSWVGLFGCIDHDNVVTEKTEAIAERFSLSRASWLTYRSLLSDVGLIEQERSQSQHRPTVVRLHPPQR